MADNNPIVKMELEAYGTIEIELYPDTAPQTVYNFISLVKKGFYDDNTIHRVVPQFVIQGGDPNGNGTGGPGYHIKGEFKQNGFDNTLKHERGVLSMARRGDSYDSAGSQFFVCLNTMYTSQLNGGYATFGKVVSGMDAVDRLAASEPVADPYSGKLRNNVKIIKTTVDTKGIDYPEPEKL